MRLVVLDTNFIVSAGIHPKSAPAKLVMDWILDGQSKPSRARGSLTNTGTLSAGQNFDVTDFHQFG